MQGKRVDLLTFTDSGGDEWNVPPNPVLIAYIGVGVVGANIYAGYDASLGWEYNVTLGLDTTGFYIDHATHIGVFGSVSGTLSGTLNVFGFDVAEASGSVGITASAKVSLNDPDPRDGRLYLDELYNGSNLGQSFLDALQFDFTIDLTAKVKASIGLCVPFLGPAFKFPAYSKDFDLRVSSTYTRPPI